MFGFKKAKTTIVTSVSLAIGEKDGHLFFHRINMTDTDLEDRVKLSMKDKKQLADGLSHDYRRLMEEDGYTLLFLVSAVGLKDQPLDRFAVTTVFNPDGPRLTNEFGEVRAAMVITQNAAVSDKKAYTLFEDWRSLKEYVYVHLYNQQG